ncbi:MAG: hypothetical protein HOD85_06235, partial [Deltaproteobacteria bacterium]|nr:hypothetical protein [Deltaproteobacteria bacterium]
TLPTRFPDRSGPVYKYPLDPDDSEQRLAWDAIPAGRLCLSGKDPAAPYNRWESLITIQVRTRSGPFITEQWR